MAAQSQGYTVIILYHIVYYTAIAALYHIISFIDIMVGFVKNTYQSASTLLCAIFIW